MKVASYEEWMERERESKKPDDLVDCYECDGTGESECCECGHERECPVCEGDSKIRWDEVPEREWPHYFSRSRYLEAVKADLTALAGWLAKPPEAVFIEAGFVPYTHARTKKLDFMEGAA